MSEINRIEDQLKRTFEGGAWHGPSVREILRDVTAAQAAARLLPGAHSIWEIACHIATWQHCVRRRLEEKVALDPADEENFSTLRDTSETAWRATLDDLEKGQRALRETILRLCETNLADPVAGKDYNVYVMLHGVIQHNLYHAGQMALLKKAL